MAQIGTVKGTQNTQELGQSVDQLQKSLMLMAVSRPKRPSKNAEKELKDQLAIYRDLQANGIVPPPAFRANLAHLYALATNPKTTGWGPFKQTVTDPQDEIAFGKYLDLTPEDIAQATDERKVVAAARTFENLKKKGLDERFIAGVMKITLPDQNLQTMFAGYVNGLIKSPDAKERKQGMELMYNHEMVSKMPWYAANLTPEGVAKVASAEAEKIIQEPGLARRGVVNSENSTRIAQDSLNQRILQDFQAQKWNLYNAQNKNETEVSADEKAKREHFKAMGKEDLDILHKKAEYMVLINNNKALFQASNPELFDEDDNIKKDKVDILFRKQLYKTPPAERKNTPPPTMEQLYPAEGRIETTPTPVKVPVNPFPLEQMINNQGAPLDYTLSGARTRVRTPAELSLYVK